MHHFKHFCHTWKRNHTLALATTQDTIHVESRGHHRHGGGGNFGVRRPLRYLSHHLDLDDSQTRKVASVLNRLKTEQEQATLDQKRTVQALADLMIGEEPHSEELKVALTPRMESAKRMQDEVIHAYRSLHAVLDDDQRGRLADLLNSGSIAI